MLVDQFIKKKIPFLAINEIILSILKNRNYKKYAIKVPNNLTQIYNIDSWARKQTLKMINYRYE